MTLLVFPHKVSDILALGRIEATLLVLKCLGN